ncbi:anti-sigma factor family protein [Kiloniella sp.]|uniref:anti-sigma factor family protein n=1 Tax=Kiloniella sp. TaxID=1938587 RepID=UPI003A8CDD45
MSQKTHFSDEDLTAFLDGEASAELAQKIESALEVDAVLMKRLEDLSIPVDELKTAMQQVTDQAPSLPDVLIDRTLASNKSPRSLLYAGSLAASVLISLVVGGLFGKTYFAPSEAQGWKHYVAAYQSLYVGDTLGNIQLSPEQIQKNLEDISGQIGFDLVKMTADSELSFKRAQLLGFKGKPLVQMAYLSPDGQPVALCIIRTNKDNTETIGMEKLEGMAAASWRKNGYAFLFIGGENDRVIREGAARFQALL